MSRAEKAGASGDAAVTEPVPFAIPTRLTSRRVSDRITDHIMSMIYAGALRPGDRIDVEVLVQQIGVSRSPIREAILELQRDGFVADRFHRTPVVAGFDAEVIADTFDLYGVLWARASSATAKATAASEERAEMSRLIDVIRELTSPEEIDATAYHYRRCISRIGGTQRLRALLRSFQNFVPTEYRRSVPGLADSLRDGIIEEHTAIVARSPRKAAEATRRLYQRQASTVIDDLRRRRVIE